MPGAPGVPPGIAERLADAAGVDGTLSLTRFMEIALYAPGAGYYALPGRALGARGDFYTAAHASPLFGAAVAERAWAEYLALERPDPFVFVELGAGDGTLAADLLAHLARAGRPLRGWRMVIVDRSATMREASLDRLHRLAAQAAVPLRLLPELSELDPFVGCLVANELLDAQPARRLQWDGAAWNELYVRVEEGRGSWADGRPAREPVPGPPSVESGQRPILDQPVGLRGVLRTVADRLVAGSAIFLDYGMEQAELLRAHPRGTLRAYRGHRELSDPLAAPGSADMSCFVDFTTLRGDASAAGLRLHQERSQAEALVAWGLPELQSAAEAAEPSGQARIQLALAVKNLLFGFERFHAFEWGPVGR